jgi:hypothetical protein
MESVHFSRNAAIQMDVALVAIKPIRAAQAELFVPYPINITPIKSNLMGLG